MKIVFLDAYTVNNSDMSAIENLGDFTAYRQTHESEILERCEGVDVVICNKVPLKAETLAAMRGVRLICIAATGMNNIDLEAAAKAGIAVINTEGYSTYSVAELTFAGALGLLKQIIYFDNYVKSGGYTNAELTFDFTRPTYELHGKKWGIIGLGNIGKRVAAIATAFGCEVSYHSTSGTNNDSAYPAKSLHELLIQSDIVSIHAPLNDKTLNLIDYHQLSLMKHTAIVINVARGGIINEQGLTRALNDNLIAGAAIDVYSREPMTADNYLNRVRDKYKLLLTPHSAWATTEAMQKLVDTIAKNIETFFAAKK